MKSDTNTKEQTAKRVTFPSAASEQIHVQQHHHHGNLEAYIILPAFGIVHAASVYACNDLKTWGLLVGLDIENDEIVDE
jgi:hypothetical protein